MFLSAETLESAGRAVETVSTICVTGPVLFVLPMGVTGRRRRPSSRRAWWWTSWSERLDPRPLGAVRCRAGPRNRSSSRWCRPWFQWLAACWMSMLAAFSPCGWGRRPWTTRGHSPHPWLAHSRDCRRSRRGPLMPPNYRKPVRPRSPARPPDPRHDPHTPMRSCAHQYPTRATRRAELRVTGAYFGAHTTSQLFAAARSVARWSWLAAHEASNLRPSAVGVFAAAV